MAQDRLVLVVNKAGAVVADVLGRRPRYQWPRFPRGPKHQAQNGTVQVGLHQSLSDESDPMIDESDLVFPLAFFSRWSRICGLAWSNTVILVPTRTLTVPMPRPPEHLPSSSSFSGCIYILLADACTALSISHYWRGVYMHSAPLMFSTSGDTTIIDFGPRLSKFVLPFQ